MCNMLRSFMRSRPEMAMQSQAPKANCPSGWTAREAETKADTVLQEEDRPGAVRARQLCLPVSTQRTQPKDNRAQMRPQTTTAKHS